MPGRVLPRTTVVALAAALAVAGCGSGDTSSAESTATTTVTGTPADATTAATTGSAVPAPPTTAAAGRPGGGATGGSSAGGGTGNGGARSGAGPSIVYFRVAQKPSCPAGTSVNPIPGTPVVLEWKASNVDSVALSVDGPGVYADNYPPTGSETLNFPCSGSGGDIQRHTYLLTVRNAHGKQTKSLVVSATVHDVPQV